MNLRLGGVSVPNKVSPHRVLLGVATTLIEVSDTEQFCDLTTLKSLIACSDVDLLLLDDFFR